MIYQFTKRYKVAYDPQPIGEELERIRQKHDGKLRTNVVVDESKSKNSPLHPLFVWDDAEAGSQWRQKQARDLIRAVVVIQNEGDEPEPAFWNVCIRNPTTQRSEYYYQSSVVIAESPQEYASALNRMRTNLAGAEIGLQQLLRLAPKADRLKVRKATAHVVEAHRVLEPG